MPLKTGHRLGPYEIVASLGAGGMGEVYRARDARLGRDVAIKVLPENLSADAERLRRFEKEARAASALNHPNLVTVLDIGSEGGVAFIAMELVAGRTLREVLADGAVPTRRLLAIAAQAGDGLAKAHAAGIVHRDLKPENLMVTGDGFVKILDFGLAKLTQPEVSGATAVATVSGQTEPGVIMGTAGYMSPEQALGRPLDFRSDQFSLGSILYEMATGRRAFSKDSHPETLTAIIRDEPEPIGALAPMSPAPLRWVVERCLAKDPEDRYASTRDLARDLATLKERLAEGSSVSASGPSAPAPAAPVRRGGRGLPWAIAALALLAAGAALWSASRRKTESRPVVRFSVAMPEGLTVESGDIEGQTALSPDGRRLAFVGRSQGNRQLYVRDLDSLEVRPLAGTEGGVSPAWSPDSRSLAFFADGKLHRVELAGGPPRTICDAPFLETVPSWGSSDQILFAHIGGNEPGIYVVNASGGAPRRVVYKDAEENRGVWPSFLPDGRHFLYLSRDFMKGEDRRWYLRVASLESPETTTLSDAIWSRVEYAEPGFLLYVRQGSLFAQRFDAKALRLSGEAVPLAERVYYFNGPAQSGFSASQAGVLSYEKLLPPSRVAWLDRSGRPLETIPLPGIVSSLRLSPDGRSIAAALRDEKLGTSDVWLYDLDRKLAVRLTLDVGDDQYPVWSPDGTTVYFRGDRMGPPDVFSIAASTPGRDALLLRRPGVQHPDDVSADGRFMIFTEWSRRTNGDLWLLPLEKPDAEPVPLQQTDALEAEARFSPDGRFIAFVSDEAGAPEVYLRPVAGRGERVRVSGAGGHMPRWRRDGRELFYFSAAGELMAVPIAAGDRLQPGAPAALFRLEGEVRDFDVDATGQRFLIDDAPRDRASLALILNWPTLLETALSGRSARP